MDAVKTLTVRKAQPAEATAWDEFVSAHLEGRFCHLWGFRQPLEKAYGYKCVYLTIHLDGEQIGIFPSVAVRHGSPRLVSQPFNEYGGPLLRNFSPELYAQLAQTLLRAAYEENCSSIEIRGGLGCGGAEAADCWFKVPLHSYAVLALDKEEKIWRKSLTNEARKGVNRARKEGFLAEVRRGAHAIADPFYTLYLASMKRLGVPPHSRRFFLELAAGLGERLVAAWVLAKEEPAAILLGCTSGIRLQIWITASDPKTWAARPNDLAHWELIRWASANGLRLFDFGSVRYAGQLQFKKKWGAALRDYCYYLIDPSGCDSPKLHTVRSSSQAMTLMANLWRTLVPLKLSALIGPPIRKYLTK